MKWKIVFLVALIVGALGGSWLKNLPGFVIIAYEKTSYEMRLWVAVAIILFIWSLFLLFGILLRSLLTSAGKMKGWQGGRQWKKARKQTIQGMLAFSEGRWLQSEKAMIAAAKQSDTKLVNYLIAAQAAQYQKAEGQNSVERRDAYLRAAHKLEPSAGVAIGITQAQLQLDNCQNELALATLNELKIKSPNHPFLIKLLCVAHQRLNDWGSIVALLPAIKKFKVHNEEKLDGLENESVQNLLNSIAENNELEKLKDVWQKLPSHLRKKESNQLHFIMLLTKFEQMEEAERLIKPFFKKNAVFKEADNDACKDNLTKVIRLFGKIKLTNSSQQFNFLENWYTQSKEAPSETYLSLGKIAFNAELWGKARFYLERSLQANPSAETYLMMANTLKKLNDHELAGECFKQGLEFVVNKN
ncbi:MAG: hypothetical protein COA86_00525 [Kangiella sp.]|nr:MAG: hypothetical protein COA86_00525 [Kangiella sp.]